MMDTALRYRLINRDMAKTLETTSKDPQVKRESEHFLTRIKEIKSVDEFVDDFRVFNYAMRAMGLEDMAYAKAFMKKALNEGVKDPNSFANKLTDKRFKKFVEAFSFVSSGGIKGQAAAATTATHTKEQVEAQKNKDNYFYAVMKMVIPNSYTKGYTTMDYNKRQKVWDEILADPVLKKNVQDIARMPTELREQSAWKQRDYLDKKLKLDDLRKTFKLQDMLADVRKEQTAEIQGKLIKDQQKIVDSYLKQTLELTEGASSEGVRLALYFKRKIGDILPSQKLLDDPKVSQKAKDNWVYEILADPALYKFVRSTINMPDQMVGGNVDKQATFILSKMKVSELNTPEALDKTISKFTSLYDINNNVGFAPTVSLFTNAGMGINANTLAQFNAIKFGG
ncbi:DUF1217 domain-containing protein [Polycladidibacter hongkongensis]|uniref:DUF1217 domain-containing protein n=1 Tax=Polycladidibacter hongkongensis TaxID=1647556 RepID=UPI0008334F34|nr:DUF1217 domain-containing protein [Pseudovibrio hongkongensis]